LAAAWVGAESMIVNRISRIVGVADRMRVGDLSVRTGMSDDTSEFGQLAVTLDSLAAALQERRRDNEQLLAQLRLLNGELEARVVDRTRQLVKSNERLLSSQAELRRLSHQLMRATEAERARISREIHDQLGQMLTAIKIEIRSARRRLISSAGAPVAAAELAPDAIPAAVTKLDDTSQMLDEMVTLVRRIAADLRPGLLDDFGLAATVDWQLQEFRKMTGVDYTLDADIDERRITPNQATAAFRILQESLTNVARHAQATAVNVRLAMDESGLTLQVQDNGRGLTSSDDGRPRSLGLLGMHERAVEFGGSVEIDGPPGKGTSVTLWLPLRPPNDGIDWSLDSATANPAPRPLTDATSGESSARAPAQQSHRAELPTG
ncbi:MAG: ATP-binding protein, partial [Caldilineaceae bacterium]